LDGNQHFGATVAYVVNMVSGRPQAAPARAARPAFKALFVSPWARRLGGAEIILWSLLRHMDRERIRPAVVFFEPGPFVDEVRSLGISATVVPASRLRRPRETVGAMRAVAAAIRAQRPDVVVNWSAKAHLYGAPACLAVRPRPLMVWWQQMAPDGHWMDRLATALPADAVGVYSSVAGRSQGRLWPARDTFVVHPGTEDPGVVDAGARARAREALGIVPGRRVLTIVGRLQPWKGQDRFIEAIATLCRKGMDVQGIVVGGAAFGLSVDYAKSLAPLANRLGIADRILFSGQVDDVSGYLRASDLLVNASELEPFGMVLLEAMAHGVAVLAVDGGGPSDIVSHGVDGLLARSGSVEDLVRCLDDVVGDEERIRQLGRAGRARFIEAFTCGASADRVIEELQSRLPMKSIR